APPLSSPKPPGIQGSPFGLRKRKTRRPFKDGFGRSKPGNPLMRRYRRRAVKCPLWPSNLAADQQRDEQRCSDQAGADYGKKSNIRIVVSHSCTPAV